MSNKTDKWDNFNIKNTFPGMRTLPIIKIRQLWQGHCEVKKYVEEGLSYNTMFMVHHVLKYFLASWWSVIQNIVNWLSKYVQYHLSKEHLRRTCTCSVISVPVGGLASLGTRAFQDTVWSYLSKMYTVGRYYLWQHSSCVYCGRMWYMYI